jgi:hypothetical protein
MSTRNLIQTPVSRGTENAAEIGAMADTVGNEGINTSAETNAVTITAVKYDASSGHDHRSSLEPGRLSEI